MGSRTCLRIEVAISTDGMLEPAAVDKLLADKERGEKDYDRRMDG